SCANHPTQYAVIEALNGSQEESIKMAKSFRERRDLIVKLLNGIDGFKCHSPGGAFYVWPNVTEACKKIGAKNSEEFRKILLDKGVAVLADIHFGGKNPGQKQEYIRLSYATSKEGIIEGVKRIKEFVER
ncbi:MAG: aminotransferase class I/II-fold pyridoxal phosphate-dependent enzyme, partial [Candidatus ainarchaeum sp.]|nr:aminotransferase class I/II-fold pyridoxal phosphate-dependent enzyme [Candidatus ainarchaeum sp.]